MIMEICAMVHKLKSSSKKDVTWQFEVSLYLQSIANIQLNPEKLVSQPVRSILCNDCNYWVPILTGIQRVRVENRSVGHNYNIMDINKGKMITVEAASNGRWSQKEIAAEPLFHANMYMHLQVNQVLSLYPYPRMWLLFYWFLC